MTTKTRITIWIALAVVVLASVSVAAVRGSGPKTSRQRIDALEQQVRCPSSGLPVYSAKTACAYSIAGYITHSVKAGEANSEIIDGLVASYGDSVLVAPPTNGVSLFIWALPIALVVVFGVEAYRIVSGRRSTVLALQGGQVGERDEELADTAPDVAESEAGEQAESEKRPRYRPSRRVAQVGAALVLVGVGAGGALLLSDRGNSIPPETTAEALSSGETLSALGDQKAALVQFDKVLASDPSQPYALSYAGWIGYNIDKSKSAKRVALAELNSAVVVDPHLAIAHLFDGLALYYGDHSTKAALSQIGDFLSDHPSKTMLKQARTLVAPLYKAVGGKLPAQFGVTAK